LGLPIVEEIAGLFGGHLTLGEGPDGKGLKASVTFPAAIAGPAAIRGPAAVSA
jgi:two-component system sensor histidine kinase TctE